MLKFVKLICLFFCAIILNSCVSSLEFQQKKAQGLYPETADFPYTKWVCHEIDMEIYMFGYEESTMIGTYIVNDVKYRVVAYFEWDQFNFNIYSNTLISESKYSNSMVHCEQSIPLC